MNGDAWRGEFNDISPLGVLEFERGFPSGLNAYGKNVTATNIKSSARSLMKLTSLSLRRATVTDGAWQEIAKLSNLRKLTLGETEMSPKAWTMIGKLTNLTSLDLDFMDVTDEGWTEIAKLNQLTFVRNYPCLGLVTATCWESIAKLTNLTGLWLNRGPVLDVGWSVISKIKSLTSLSLRSLQARDQWLKHLAGLENLIHLDLSYSKITDATGSSPANAPGVRS